MRFTFKLHSVIRAISTYILLCDLHSKLYYVMRVTFPITFRYAIYIPNYIPLCELHLQLHPFFYLHSQLYSDRLFTFLIIFRYVNYIPKYIPLYNLYF